jgi:hypothetical protein
VVQVRESNEEPLCGLEIGKKNVEKKTREAIETPKKKLQVSVNVFLFGCEKWKKKKIVAISCDPNKATTTKNSV